MQPAFTPDVNALNALVEIAVVAQQPVQGGQIDFDENSLLGPTEMIVDDEAVRFAEDVPQVELVSAVFDVRDSPDTIEPEAGRRSQGSPQMGRFAVGEWRRWIIYAIKPLARQPKATPLRLSALPLEKPAIRSNLKILLH